ncbi:uncharacterized protein K02A2.6-like [Leguminivora glycinivorella]|uniref:uncharacterized protein K02A2.6-like n=1 Tax=Leguminivora glycinivorella TaxID=1035111 RepID=UPI00200C4F12|nr:uncharacterized protein K02A2.6-like [Leguminivora glycinivorella]
MLLSTLPPDLHERVHDLSSPDDPINKTFEELSDLLDQYIDPKPSIWASQHTFITRMQQADESVPIYASELKRLSLNCEFKCTHCKKPTIDSFLSLQLIRGLKDGDIRTKILQEDETMTFSKLVHTATSMETGKNENSTMSTSIQKLTTENINKISQAQKETVHPPRYNTKRTQITIRDLKGKCYRCGGNDHKANECGAIKSTCIKCQKEGHLARVCMQRTERNQTNLLNHSTSSVSTDGMADIHLIKSELSDKFIITVDIEGKKVNMEYDTGAALSAMSLKDYKNLKISNKILHTSMTFTTYTKEPFEPVGVAYVKCNYKKQTFYGKLYIFDMDVEPVLGRSWMKEFKVDLADMNSVETCMKTTKLEKLLEEYDSTVFNSNLGEIPNVRGHLTLKDDARPIFIKPRRIPYALRAKVDDEIERLEKQGIITKIDHSDWGTPVVPIVKPNGSIRLCADYKVTLNKAIKDEQYPIPIIEDIFAEMNGGQIFCTLDITQAYLNMVMDEESALLQTLSTHKGTFKVNRLMFGVKVAPSLWQKFMDQLLMGIEGVKCFFDDIIIQGSSEEQLLTRLKLVLQKLKDSNLRVNKEKCNFFKRSINYLGHTIDKDGLHKNQDKVKAIANAQRPTNINELRTFLGMANYYNKFIPNLSSITNPLNELLKKGTKYIWTTKCEESFKSIKKEILSERILMHFDQNKTLILATDASPTGLGAVLSHRLPDGSERPIAFASRTLTSSEKKYSQIDKEATAIFWGLKKFFHYCYGRKFTLITDHKPLTSIFHPHQTLPTLSTMRLFHYAHFLSGFDYNIEYRNTTKNANADYLSRFPVEKTKDNKIDQHYVFQMKQINSINISPEIIAKETKEDPELRNLLQTLQSGASLRESGYNDNELTLQNDCILKGTRVMIPQRLRQQILEELHTGHIGMLKMKLLARSFVYWKNIDKDIEQKVKSCRTCRLEQNAPSKAPIHHWEEPAGPWQRIHIDFAGPICGYQLFIVVDAFSKWIEVIPTKTTTSSYCIKELDQIFDTFGVPYTLVSDNGRQFISQEFQNFMRDNGIVHKTIAPYHPATNGQAERYVQIIKRALHKLEGESGAITDKIRRVKSTLRSTPASSGYSPYLLMFGREVRTRLTAKIRAPPKCHAQSAPNTNRQFALNSRVQARNYSGSGQKWKFGTVKRRLGNLHYEIAIDDGRVWIRHLDQLLPASGIPGNHGGGVS